MKTKFTKGEWVSDIRCGCCAVYPKASKDEWEQGLHNDDENIYYKGYANVSTNPELAFRSEEKIANAYLIASAPRLYAELKRLSILMDFLDKETHPNIELDAVKYDIENLLAEARGE